MNFDASNVPAARRVSPCCYVSQHFQLYTLGTTVRTVNWGTYCGHLGAVRSARFDGRGVVLQCSLVA